jgi:hypothetical protein
MCIKDTISNLCYAINGMQLPASPFIYFAMLIVSRAGVEGPRRTAGRAAKYTEANPE